MKQSLLKIVRYFGMFSHPLTSQEIHQFLSIEASPSEVEAELTGLVNSKDLKRHHGFYQAPEMVDLSQQRIEKEERAKALIRKSILVGRIIHAFPFVRGVAISGSVSKLSASENADLDFFILTEKDKLWIARSMLHMFKKMTFLTRDEKYFCMNYFLALDHLEVPFKNFYTALELKTLIPVTGLNHFDELNSSNKWTSTYLPNHNDEPLAKLEVRPFSYPIKSLLEQLIDLFFSKGLNLWLMRLTDQKWRRKFAKLNLSEEDYDRALMTRPYLSKNHPNDYQKKVLSALNENPLRPSIKDVAA